MYFIASSQEAEGKIEFFPMLRKSGYLWKSSSQFIIRATLHLTSLINADETNALETPKCQKPKKSTPSVNFPAEVAYIPFTTSHALSILSVFYNAQNSFNSQNNIIRIPHRSRTAGDWWSQDSNPAVWLQSPCLSPGTRHLLPYLRCIFPSGRSAQFLNRY